MHPPRATSFSYLGLYRYFLTFCTDGRRKIFTAAEVVNRVLAHIQQAAANERFEVSAYCFMPDHLHLLCRGCSSCSDLRSFVTEAKQRSGFAIKKSSGQRLWQVGYYDHVIRDDEELLAVVAYIIGNPVRGGLVSRAQDYTFSGSTRFSMREIAECVQMWSPPRRQG